MAARRGGHQQKRARRDMENELDHASHKLWDSPLASGLVLRWAEGNLTMATKHVGYHCEHVVK
jgi:hypothetical protein